MANYGDIAGSNAYHLARGNEATWVDADDELKLAALVRASAWLDGTYGDRYPGRKTDGRAQELGWPRIEAVDCEGEEIASDEVPAEIENATYEAALRELTAPGSLSPDFVRSSGVKREKVGALEVEYQAVTGTVDDVVPILPVVDGLLACLVGKRSSTSVGFFGRA